ncbi:flowering time control protein FPA-like [Helianthus annuus]|uniref:flowering time control protein FPA-like n=1 Tax=Helianthus annuus TaxID=4232 RepID=UPI000B8F9BFA|nr:flowering time control protein FPA-like [Helianthus annuus]
MRPPFKSNNTISNKNLTDSSPSDAMFSNLWVGNLTADVTELDLRNLFEKHDVVESVTRYPARSYAFVNMKRPEDAKRAKESLQAVVLRGGSLKIDFAKPVCIVFVVVVVRVFRMLLSLLLYGIDLLYVYVDIRFVHYNFN